MNTLGYVILPLALALLGLLATRFGRDSREGIEVPAQTWLGGSR